MCVRERVRVRVCKRECVCVCSRKRENYFCFKRLEANAICVQLFSFLGSFVTEIRPSCVVRAIQIIRGTLKGWSEGPCHQMSQGGGRVESKI